MRSIFRFSCAAILSVLPFAVIASAQTPYQLGSSGPVSNLAAGSDYYAIEAWVPAGGTHGAPYLAAHPLNTPTQSGLVVGTESGGTVTFGPYIGAPSLWNYATGNDPSPISVANDLQRLPAGSPILIGNSTSPQAFVAGGQEATTWQLSADGTTLIPTAQGFISGSSANISGLVGGTPGEGYAGSDSIRPSVITTPGNGQHLESGGPFGSGLAYDLNGGLTVGDVNFVATYWALQSDSTWLRQAPQLPVWSDGTGTITEVAGGLMGGFLYKADIDDALPVIWNADGTINRIFDLPGYGVSEMIVDQGVVTTLLNSGTFGLHGGPSYLYGAGWSDARLYFGDLYPSLPTGVTGYIEDIASGGSQYALANYRNGSATWYGVTAVETSVSAVPEPSTLVMALLGMATAVLARCRKFV